VIDHIPPLLSTLYVYCVAGSTVMYHQLLRNNKFYRVSGKAKTVIELTSNLIEEKFQDFKYIDSILAVRK
jgi:hypothetical protein